MTEEDPMELQSDWKNERGLLDCASFGASTARTHASRFGDGTLADALAERDVLKIRYNAYSGLGTTASTLRFVRHA